LRFTRDSRDQREIAWGHGAQVEFRHRSLQCVPHNLPAGAGSATVGEYSVSQLARELRAGRVSVIQTASLFDQAMASLIGARGTSATLH
jgi:hypothetical protein